MSNENRSNPTVAAQMISKKLGNDVRAIEGTIKSIEIIMEAMERTGAKTFGELCAMSDAKVNGKEVE